MGPADSIPVNGILFLEGRDIPPENLLSLYNDAGWKAYTSQPEILKQAIQNSLYVLTAWENDTLVGLIRVVGDGLTIVYIQDILVLKASKRKGIGRILLTTALQKFGNVRQKVLLTDDSLETRGFYEALGFSSCDDGKMVAFVKMN